MPAALPLKQPVKVGQLLRRRLRELKRTPRELADAVNVSEDYMADLVAGRRRPPAPGRTDLYAPMTKFLRLHRNDLPTCARAERAAGPAGRRRPDAEVSRQVLELCLPERQRVLQRRLSRPDGAELDHVIVGRLLQVAQGFVNRKLEDEVGLRMAATRDGCTYLEARMRLLEFLDADAESLTPRDCDEFLRPRITSWDIDLETHAMRIVLK
ncbi:MAG: hypothetical protein DMD61_08305 [Gemmatimonadetes bacterium]|nr:MAG: hypothetical protein DMD61_08305 [Gemmatimonadota bacterium]